jgi:hypothetical protein
MLVTIKGQAYERFYDDGAWYGRWPGDEAEALCAELAFRAAFVETAHNIIKTWRCVDARAIEAAWRARERARHLAEVRVRSADYFGVTDRHERRRFRSKQIAYRLGHRVEASRTRAIHHAMVFVEQEWDEARKSGMAWEIFAPWALPAWVRNVDEWAARPLRLGYCSPPPRPLEPWPRGMRQPPDTFDNPQLRRDAQRICVLVAISARKVNQKRTTP